MNDERGGSGADTTGGAGTGSATARVVVSEQVKHARPAAGVVVGVDGSRSALAAVRWAAAEAARRAAELDLVQVLPAAGSSGLEPGLPHGRARALLYRAAGAALAVAPTLHVSMASVYGRVGPALVSYADRASLLVVGSNGPGGPIPLSVGRILAEVTTHAECPVIVVPRTRVDPSAPSSRPVFVAVENMADDERALDFAAQTAHRWAVPLVALTGAAGRDQARHSKTHALTTSDAARYQDQYPGLTIEARTVKGRSDGPMAWAGRGAQLIVVGSSRRNRAAGVLPGWTRHFLPILSPCAVAVVPRATRSTDPRPTPPATDSVSGATRELGSQSS